MEPERCLLVFRFSAMGDVAMSASIIKEFWQQHSDIKIIVVSRSAFKPFFDNIDGVKFHALRSDDKHKGLRGLFSLYKELKKYKPIAIADLHNNLRSNILSFYFKAFHLTKSIKIDKGRTEKKQLTRRDNKINKQLKPTTERYAHVFRQLYFSLKLSHKLTKNTTVIDNSLKKYVQHDKEVIGISPFAKHREKVYPLAKMENVIAELNRLNYRILIFGGGSDEQAKATLWEEKFDNVISLIGKTTLDEELQVMGKLDLMLSMDSSGMHMASLTGTPVVSIWGATHPHAGFLGYGQDEKDCIQIDLHCRPCSVFGNKICYRGDFACMNGIDSGMIVEHIIEKINNGKTSFSDSTR